MTKTPTYPLDRPSDADSETVLERILREADDHHSRGRPFLTVFDLDSTLFDLTLRVSTIIDHFAEDPENRKKFPSECSSLKSVKILRTDWGIGEALNRLGLSESRNPELWRELHSFWAMSFFSNHFLHHDEPLPGSVEYVKTLTELGAHVMYLTGRDVPRMLKGTEQSLSDCGFPLGIQGVSLVLKPQAKLDDAWFKIEIIKDVAKNYDKIWFFENEPVNLNLAAAQCPEIGLVFIDSTHSGREQVADTLDRIQHFEVDLSAFRKY
jgi:hypothetical protein